MKDTLKLIKSIFIDILILFKNFLHWNISKILISLSSIWLSFLMALPFIVLLFILYFSFDLNLYFNSFDVSLLDLLWLLWNRPIVFTLFMLFAVIWFLFGLFGYSYRKVLFTKLNLLYLDWKKLNYLKNKYFDFKLIYKYFQVIALVSLFLIIPIVIFFIWFVILFFIFWWAEWVQALISSSQFNIFTLIAFIFLIICFIAFVYISYRLYFAVIMLVDQKHYDEEKPSFYLKESYEKTKSIFIFMKFVLIMLLLSIVILPFWKIQENFSDTLNEVRAFREYSLLGEIEKKEVENNPNYSFINDLKIKYSSTTWDELKTIEVTYFYLNYLFIIINFLLILWLFEMATVSFYKHEIIKK